MKKEDWQKGNDSEMNSLQRAREHDEWLKQIHQEVKDEIFNKNKPSTEEELIIGFPKD